jgi:hypothetical protein
MNALFPLIAGIHLLVVEHDDWCRYFVRGNPSHCSCAPIYRLVAVNETNVEAISAQIEADDRRTAKLQESLRN